MGMFLLLPCYHFAGILFQTVLTYNAALLELLGLDTLGPGADIPSRTDRRDVIIDQLKNTTADIICLQEVQ